MSFLAYSHLLIRVPGTRNYFAPACDGRPDDHGMDMWGGANWMLSQYPEDVSCSDCKYFVWQLTERKPKAKASE